MLGCCGHGHQTARRSGGAGTWAELLPPNEIVQMMPPGQASDDGEGRALSSSFGPHPPPPESLPLGFSFVEGKGRNKRAEETMGWLAGSLHCAVFRDAPVAVSPNKLGTASRQRGAMLALGLPVIASAVFAPALPATSPVSSTTGSPPRPKTVCLSCLQERLQGEEV